MYEKPSVDHPHPIIDVHESIFYAPYENKIEAYNKSNMNDTIIKAYKHTLVPMPLLSLPKRFPVYFLIPQKQTFKLLKHKNKLISSDSTRIILCLSNTGIKPSVGSHQQGRFYKNISVSGRDRQILRQGPPGDRSQSGADRETAGKGTRFDHRGPRQVFEETVDLFSGEGAGSFRFRGQKLGPGAGVREAQA